MITKIDAKKMDFSINFEKFLAFLQFVKEKQPGSFKINQAGLDLKMKLPCYKDSAQIIALYQNIFMNSIPSNSKKKSGTILIIWTIIKFSEVHQLNIEEFVIFSFFLFFLFICVFCVFLVFFNFSKFHVFRKKAENWHFLCELFPSFSQEKIQMRWLSVQKSVEQKLPWNEEEDQALLNLIKYFFSIPSLKPFISFQ